LSLNKKNINYKQLLHLLRAMGRLRLYLFRKEMKKYLVKKIYQIRMGFWRWRQNDLNFFNHLHLNVHKTKAQIRNCSSKKLWR